MSETFDDRPMVNLRVGGEWRLWRFENGYGASVVRNSISYGHEEGLWELAVLRYDGPGEKDRYLHYGTPITDDVIGHLDEQDVQNILTDIKNLKDPDE